MTPHASTVHLFHHALGRGGGMERYARVLAAALRDLGCEVVFHARRADSGLAEQLGVRAAIQPVARFPRKLQDWRFFRRIERDRLDLPGVQISLTRVPGRNLVVCGGTHRGYLSRLGRIAGPFDRLQIWLEARSYRTARRVVAHSRLCRAEVIRWYGLPPDRVLTLYPPVEAEFRPGTEAGAAERWRRERGLPPDAVVLLFPSTGHRRKGLPDLCAALRGLPSGFVVAVAGSRHWGRTPAFIRHLGYVDDMPAAYRAADFTLLASRYEPFGLVGPESVLCGTPLIFADGIGCLEVVKPGAVIRFPAGDRDAIRRAVAEALERARTGRHRLADPRGCLDYDPAPALHAQALLAAATC